MKKLILILTIVSICTLLFADSTRKNKKYGLTGLPEYKAKTQKELIDSLEAELVHAKEDTNKVNLLIKLSDNKSTITGDNAIPDAEAALELAKNINWKLGESKANKNLGNIYFDKGKYDMSLTNYETALKIAKEINNKNLIGTLYANIGGLYSQINNYEKAIEFAEKGLFIGEEYKYNNIITVASNILGNLNKSKSNYNKALEYYNKALNAAKLMGDNKKQGIYANNIGNLYITMGDYDKGLEAHVFALKSAEVAIDSSTISRTLASIASIHQYKGEYSKALELYFKAIEIMKVQHNIKLLIVTYQSIGNLYVNMSEHVKAYESFVTAIEYSKANNNFGMEYIYNSIANVEDRLGEKDKALKSYLKAYDVATNKELISVILQNICEKYIFMKEYDKALEYLNKSIKNAEEIDNIPIVINNNKLLGQIYSEYKQFEKAKNILENALKMSKDMKLVKEQILCNRHLSDLYMQIANDLNSSINETGKQEKLNKSLHYSKTALNLSKEKIDKQIALIMLTEIYVELGNNKEALEHYKKAQELKDSIFSTESKVKIANLEAQRELEVKNKELALKAKENELLQANNTNQTLALEKQRQQVALLNSQQSLQKLELEKRQNQLSLLQKDKTLAELNIRNKEAEAKSNAQEIKLLQINQKQQEDEIKTKNYQLYLSIFGIMSVLFVAFIVYRERKKSEELLLNILPATVAKRLKAKEQPIADHFDSASVMFIDIVGFTQMSANEDPKRIVVALNEVFTKFDKLADKHGLEKIKTIGDSYMVAAGIPIEQKDHALRACSMALDIKKEMQDYTIGSSKLEFRIGIDCGAVVAGVIGEKKFIYDLWSDAVNTASRMESTGIPGEIHITDNFKQELEKLSNNYKFQARETIEVKGKGQMQTWFVG